MKKGSKHSKATRIKMSLAHKGKQSGRKGKYHTKEAKEKMSKSRKGIPLSAQHKKNISKSLKGRTFSDDWKRKLSIAGIGAILSEEHRQNLSLSHKGKMMGAKHPQWRGGVSYLPYAFDFNKELKELIKKRDDYKCQLCDTTQKLVVHHIDYDKQNSDPSNLITLCNSCNSKVNTNRKSWTQFFCLQLKLVKEVG